MVRRFLRSVKFWVATLLLAATPLVGLTRGGQVAAETGDCDANAVIRCGAFTLDALKQKYQENQDGNVQALYQVFGMPTATSLDGMVEGSVTTENKVLVGDKVVATNAITAGRQNMAGSTPILNGQFYERPPSVSFNSSPLRAFVKMDQNQFKYAVIMSCGNPVKATPAEQPKQPAFEVTKDVRTQGQTAWQQQVKTKPGDTVEFRILVHNTGQTDFTKVMLRDQLPQGLEFVDGSLRVDQQAQ
ncbi:MAG TPA: hypothetical protein VFK03_01915, partial [Candidatus Saccharimonadales bacterium]|nr:hypothetical protein [Candidatus Saccharimonadales bacterium]